jgi:hypothetical protein
LCDILTLGGLALSGASAFANAQAQSQIQNARDDAMAAERIRQQKYDTQADALNTQSQDRYQDIKGQQDKTSKKLGDYFGEQATAKQANSAAPNVQMAMPASSSNITNAAEKSARGQARSFTNQQAGALGQLRSFGDLLGGIGREQAQDASLIGQIGGFKRGSSNVLPLELEAANQKGGGWKLFGDLAGGFGGLALNSGLTGGGQNLFGMSAARGVDPTPISDLGGSAARSAGGVPSLSGNSLYSLFSPYAVRSF